MERKILSYYLYSFTRYFHELALRLFYLFSGFILLILIFQWYMSTLLFFILPDDEIILLTYNSADEFSFFKLSIILSFFFYLPIGLIQLFLFIKPGLYAYQSKGLTSFLIWLLLLYIIFLFLAFYWGVPFFWELEINDLESFEGLPILTEITLIDYIDIIIDLGVLSILSLPFFLLGFLSLFKEERFKLNDRVNRRIVYLIVLCGIFFHISFCVVLIFYEIFSFLRFLLTRLR